MSAILADVTSSGSSAVLTAAGDVPMSGSVAEGVTVTVAVIMSPRDAVSGSSVAAVAPRSSLSHQHLSLKRLVSQTLT